MIFDTLLKECPEKIELPFCYSPLVSMYQGCAFPIGIIMACAEKQNKDIVPWLVGKYINWMYVPNINNKFIHYFDDSWMRNDGILQLQRIHVQKKTYKNLFEECDIVDLFRAMLSQGFYPSDYYNEEKIPGKSSYQKEKFKHDFVLTGYDDSAKLFISGGYLSDGHFHKFTIPYEIMREAYYDVCGDFITCNFWKYNENANYSFCLFDNVNYLRDYITSTTSVDIFKRGRLFGINAMTQLSINFWENFAYESVIDPRFTRGFMEHKQMMLMRMEYYLQVGIIKDSKYIEDARENFHLSELVHKLCLKYNLTGKSINIQKMQHYISQTIESEKQYLPIVLKALETEAEKNE